MLTEAAGAAAVTMRAPGRELVVAVDDDGFTRSKASLDQSLAVVAGRDPDRTGFRGGILPHYEGVAAVSSVLQRGFRHDRSAAEAEQDVGADELTGPAARQDFERLP